MGNLGHGGAQNKDTFNSAIYLICKIDFKSWQVIAMICIEILFKSQNRKCYCMIRDLPKPTAWRCSQEPKQGLLFLKDSST